MKKLNNVKSFLALALCCALCAPAYASLAEGEPAPVPVPTATPAPEAAPTSAPSLAPADADAAAVAALTPEQRAPVADALISLSGVKAATDAVTVGFLEPQTGLMLTVSANGTPSLYCTAEHKGVTCTCALTSTGQSLTIGGVTFEIWLNKSASVPKKHVKPDSINVRSGPGMDYEKTYTLLKDRVAYVYATCGTWSLVVYGESNVGFVSSGLLTVAPSASKSPKPVKDDDEDEGRPGGGRPGGRP